MKLEILMADTIQFSDAFKSEVARELEISDNVLYCWRTKQPPNGISGPLTPDRAR